MDGQRAAVHLGQPDREGQPKPGAVVLARPRAGDLAEASHRQLHLDGVHPDAVIGDGDGKGAVDIAQHDLDLAAGMAELDRVDDEIEHDLLQLAGVRPERRDDTLAADRDLDVARARLGLGELNQIGDRFRRSDQLLDEVELAGLELRHVEDVVDEPQ